MTSNTSAVDLVQEKRAKAFLEIDLEALCTYTHQRRSFRFARLDLEYTGFFGSRETWFLGIETPLKEPCPDGLS